MSNSSVDPVRGPNGSVGGQALCNGTTWTTVALPVASYVRSAVNTTVVTCSTRDDVVRGEES